MLALNLGTGKTKTLQFPKLNAARIYFSFDAPTVVCCNNAEGGSPGEPIGWDTNEPNFNTLFDWAELAWDNGGNAGLGHKTRLGGNLTQVDMFSLPLHLRLVGLSTTGPGPSTQDAGFMASRATIGKAYMALGTPWTDLLTGGIPAAPLRAVSPYHGIALGLFPSNALDSYIKQVANFYVTNTLTVTASCAQDGGIVHTLAGKVSGGALMFTDTATSVVLFGFTRPSTLAVYQNELHPINPTGAPSANSTLASAVSWRQNWEAGLYEPRCSRIPISTPAARRNSTSVIRNRNTPRSSTLLGSITLPIRSAMTTHAPRAAISTSTIRLL
jgi:Beta-1,3-glucanase